MAERKQELFNQTALPPYPDLTVATYDWPPNPFIKPYDGVLLLEMPGERNNIKVISISSLFSLLKNHPAFRFLSRDNNYLGFACGDPSADYECSLPTEGNLRHHQ